MRLLIKTLAATLALLLAGLVAALWTYRDIPAPTLETRYAGPASKFINIDGVRIHFSDEGTGPPIVLVHGDFESLIDWEPWVQALGDRHRILRFDLAAHGLTGPDPSGDYSPARTLVLLERLVDALGLRSFVLAGNTSGARLAVHYAATYPERVQKLILLNPGAVEAMSHGPEHLPRAIRALKYILPRALVATVMRRGFGDPARLDEGQVERWYALWRREGQRAAALERLAQRSVDDLGPALGRIRAPVLLLRGEAADGSTAQAQEYLQLLGAAGPVRTIGYPGLGRMALEEAGTAIGADVRAWLDGKPASPGMDAATAAGI